VTRYLVWLPKGSRTCETSREVRVILRDYATEHPQDVRFDRVFVREIGHGATEVGPFRSTQEFLEESPSIEHTPAPRGAVAGLSSRE
jgi:hypothetical protein